MEEFTILCTKEQTLKALKLGAKIKTAMSKYNATIANKNCEQGKESFDEYQKKGIIFLSNGFSAMAYIIPTVEQMIGWLRSKGFRFKITEYKTETFWKIVCENWFTCGKNTYPKEATLAAIDAALDYLILNKGE